MSETMHDHPVRLSPRGIMIARRILLSIAVATLVAAVAMPELDPSIARAESAAPAGRSGPPAPAVHPRPAEPKPPATLVGRLDLNSATGSELELLPGIGPAKAERILAFRAKHGPFKRV